MTTSTAPMSMDTSMYEGVTAQAGSDLGPFCELLAHMEHSVPASWLVANHDLEPLQHQLADAKDQLLALKEGFIQKQMDTFLKTAFTHMKELPTEQDMDDLQAQCEAAQKASIAARHDSIALETALQDSIAACVQSVHEHEERCEDVRELVNEVGTIREDLQHLQSQHAEREAQVRQALQRRQHQQREEALQDPRIASAERLQSHWAHLAAAARALGGSRVAHSEGSLVRLQLLDTARPGALGTQGAAPGADVHLVCTFEQVYDTRVTAQTPQTPQTRLVGVEVEPMVNGFECSHVLTTAVQRNDVGYAVREMKRLLRRHWERQVELKRLQTRFIMNVKDNVISVTFANGVMSTLQLHCDYPHVTAAKGVTVTSVRSMRRKQTQQLAQVPQCEALCAPEVCSSLTATLHTLSKLCGNE